MLLSMLLALSLQDPPKTVEDRLKELEEKLSALEKRSKALGEENARLEKQLADAKAARENWSKQAASAWVKRYAKAAEFTEKQSAEIEELWLAWTREDAGKAAGTATWKEREVALRGRLAEDQVPKLALAVRDEQEKAAKMSIGSFVQAAKVAPERAPGFEKAVLARLSFAEDVLLPQAHPERQAGWFKVYAAVEESVPDLAKLLAEPEQAALRETLARWKPKR